MAADEENGRGTDDGVTKSALEVWVKRLTPWGGAIALVVAIVFTSTSPVPPHLPGIALDSDSLFYVERGMVAIGALILIFGLLARALLGELPIGFSTTGITYAAEATKATTQASNAVDELNRRVDELENANRRARASLGELTGVLGELVPEVSKQLANE
jgi:hypothetical protein